MLNLERVIPNSTSTLKTAIHVQIRFFLANTEPRKTKAQLEAGLLLDL
jgi:hypothetical protein